MAILAASTGLIVEVLNKATAFAGYNLQTTVAPWNPGSFPVLSYCPSDVYYRRIEEDIIPEGMRGLLMTWAKEIQDTRMSANVACGYLDSFFPYGQSFWMMRFSGLFGVEDGNLKLSEFQATVAHLIANHMVDMFFRHMSSKNVTFQEMVDQYSLPHSKVLESSDDVRVTKFFSLRGVCYIVKHDRLLGAAKQRFTGYTVSVKRQDKTEVCVSQPKYDTVAIGNNAEVGIPRSTNYVTFPGDYVYTLTPRRFSVLSTKVRPCHHEASHERQDQCFQQSMLDVCTAPRNVDKESNCSFPAFDGFLDNGEQYSFSSRDTTVDNLCTTVKIDKHCIYSLFISNLKAEFHGALKDLFRKCLSPCDYTGYQVHRSVTRFGNSSTITVRYGDGHSAFSYVQSFEITTLGFVSSVGGILGVWIGGSFIALLHAMYYWVWTGCVTLKMKAARPESLDMRAQ